jgi:cysteine desulfurase
LLDDIVSNVPGARLNGHPVRRLPNNLNFSFPGVEGEALILGMKTVALSSGSACTADEPGPSHVLKAIGLPDELGHATLRFGLGRGNDESEVRSVAAALAGAVARLRSLSPTS